MTTILSIQSSVAYGHAGNSAAVFPLMRMGVEVWPVLTVHFSNHTGYDRWRGPLLTAEDLQLDPGRREVRRDGAEVELTRKEFGVLEVLLAAGGAVVSSEELLERVWDENADPFTTTVRVTVMTLRKKLGDPVVIETVVGSGYRVPSAGRAEAREV